jgi:putative transposase
MYNQRIDYLHENPERAGFVKDPINWKYSSAIDYYTEEGKGLLELARLN